MKPRSEIHRLILEALRSQGQTEAWLLKTAGLSEPTYRRAITEGRVRSYAVAQRISWALDMQVQPAELGRLDEMTGKDIYAHPVGKKVLRFAYDSKRSVGDVLSMTDLNHNRLRIICMDDKTVPPKLHAILETNERL